MPGDPAFPVRVAQGVRFAGWTTIESVGATPAWKVQPVGRDSR